MVSKVFSVLLIAVVVSQGYAIQEIELAEQNVNFISHPLYSRGISIAQSLFDTLLTCQLKYPNGATFEAYPTDRLPDDEVAFGGGLAWNRSCAVAFKHSARIEQFSGTYELIALVKHADESMTLRSQKFHVKITASEVEMPQ